MYYYYVNREQCVARHVQFLAGVFKRHLESLIKQARNARRHATRGE